MSAPNVPTLAKLAAKATVTATVASVSNTPAALYNGVSNKPHSTIAVEAAAALYPPPDSPPVSASRVHGKLNRRPWTQEEDELLIAAVAQLGPARWSNVALHVPNRLGKQCRERWFGHLCPEVVHGEWSAEEDRLITEGVAEVGTRWCEIVKRLPGRTDNSIKNRFAALQRQAQSKAREKKVPPATADEPAKKKKRKRSALSRSPSTEGTEPCESESSGESEPDLLLHLALACQHQASEATPPPASLLDAGPPGATVSTAAQPIRVDDAADADDAVADAEVADTVAEGMRASAPLDLETALEDPGSLAALSREALIAKIVSLQATVKALSANRSDS